MVEWRTFEYFMVLEGNLDSNWPLIDILHHPPQDWRGCVPRAERWCLKWLTIYTKRGLELNGLRDKIGLLLDTFRWDGRLVTWSLVFQWCGMLQTCNKEANMLHKAMNENYWSLKNKASLLSSCILAISWTSWTSLRRWLTEDSDIAEVVESLSRSSTRMSWEDSRDNLLETSQLKQLNVLTLISK